MDTWLRGGVVEALDLIDKSMDDETIVCKFAIAGNGVP
jgi:hypothetical protein